MKKFLSFILVTIIALCCFNVVFALEEGADENLILGVSPSSYTVSGWGYSATKDVSVLTDGVVQPDSVSYKKNITFHEFPAVFEYEKEMTFKEVSIAANNPSDLDVYGIGGITVEGYIDGDWYNLAKVTGIAPETSGKTYAITSEESITVEKLRVSITGHASSGGSWHGVSLSEIQVFRDVKTANPVGTLLLNKEKMEKPEVYIENGTTLEVAKGDVVTLKANASVTDGGKLSYKWYKDGTPISSVSTYNIYTITSDDPAGTYKVVVTNSGDSASAENYAEIVITSTSEADNIALNKTYEWESASGILDSYPDTNNKEMTDGKIPLEVSFYNNGYTAIGNGKSASAIIDLGQEMTFGSVKTVYMSTASAGLKMAGKMSVYYSNDKEEWTLFGEWTNDNAKLVGILVAEVNAVPATARYIKVSDSGSHNPGHHFISEIMVIGAEKPEYSISGKVKALGNTQDTATVELICDGETIGKVSSNDSYSFENLYSDKYILRVHKSKYASRDYEIKIDRADVTQDVEIALYGDADANGVVNTSDVLQVNRKIVGLTSIFDAGTESTKYYRLRTCNITGTIGTDTVINNMDVLQINRKIANYSSTFDVITDTVCPHAYADDYASDNKYHWYEATCGCELNVVYEKQRDTDNDSVCDICDNGIFKFTQTSVVTNNEYADSVYSKFNGDFDPVYLVPALKEGMIPQGMDVWEEEGLLLVSGYFKSTTEHPTSIIVAIDIETGEYVGEYNLYLEDKTPYTGKTGGIAVTERDIYIKEGKYVIRYPLTELKRVGEVGNIFGEISFELNIYPAYCNYSNGYLWLGNFYIPGDASYGTVPDWAIMTHNDGKKYGAVCLGFKITDETESGISEDAWNENTEYAIPDIGFSTTEKVQGFTTLSDGTVVLSRSYGRGNNSNIVLYNRYMNEEMDEADTTVMFGDFEVPFYFLDSTYENTSYTSLPMSEGVAAYDDSFFVLYESGASFYKDNGGINPTDQIWAYTK